MVFSFLDRLLSLRRIIAPFHPQLYYSMNTQTQYLTEKIFRLTAVLCGCSMLDSTNAVLR